MPVCRTDPIELIEHLHNTFIEIVAGASEACIDHGRRPNAATDRTAACDLFLVVRLVQRCSSRFCSANPPSEATMNISSLTESFSHLCGRNDLAIVPFACPGSKINHYRLGAETA